LGLLKTFSVIMEAWSPLHFGGIPGISEFYHHRELSGKLLPNLATYPTLMVKQACEILDLTLKRAGIHQFQWRFLQISLWRTTDWRASLPRSAQWTTSGENSLRSVVRKPNRFRAAMLWNRFPSRTAMVRWLR
jgi:hypothetical protein